MIKVNSEYYRLLSHVYKCKNESFHVPMLSDNWAKLIKLKMLSCTKAQGPASPLYCLKITRLGKSIIKRYGTYEANREASR